MTTLSKAFLDANILFSLCYSDKSRLHDLFKLKDVSYIVSDYVVAEAELNLEKPEQKSRLQTLTKKLQVVTNWQITLPRNIKLREKDIPVLKAAAASGCHFLITGDNRDFGIYFGKQVCGLIVYPPSEFLRLKQ